MKRRLLRLSVLAILLLSSIPQVYAQIGERRSLLSVGVNGGMQFSSVDFDPTIKQQQLVKPSFGLTMRYVCEKYFSTVCALQMEFNYVQLGWKEEILSSGGVELPDQYERTLNYLQVPFFARLAWGKEKRGVMFFFQVGPQVGLYLGDSSKRSEAWTLNAQGNPDRPNNVFQQYDMDVQRKFDYGLTGGLGIEVNTGIGHFMLEGRYYYGLNDIYNNSKKDVFGRSAHQSIIGKLTYLFDLVGQKQ